MPLVTHPHSVGDVDVDGDGDGMSAHATSHPSSQGMCTVTGTVLISGRASAAAE